MFVQDTYTDINISIFDSDNETLFWNEAIVLIYLFLYKIDKKPMYYRFSEIEIEPDMIQNFFHS